MIGYIEYYPCNRPEVRCNRNDSGTEAERYNATGKILSGKIVCANKTAVYLVDEWPRRGSLPLYVKHGGNDENT